MFLTNILISIATFIPVLISIAFFTLAERKVIAAIQRRRGPNVIGIWGLLQPFADGLKLILKEIIVPSKSKRIIFIVSPMWTFILSLTNWGIIPFSYTEVASNAPTSLLIVFTLSSFGVYGIILAGWSSQSRYSLLVSIRSASQMISYEVSLGLTFVIIALCTGSLNFIEIISIQDDIIWLAGLLPPILIIFFVTILAETNRTPFDLPEAEAELVAGYNLEYSSITFALFFLGEYNSIIIMATLTTILFMGGWSFIGNTILPTLGPIVFCFKIVVVCFIFILIRATVPRYRYDQLMDLGWKTFFPITVCYLIAVQALFTVFG